jgi:hypothetical protein
MALYSRNTLSHAPPSRLALHHILEEWDETTSWKTMPRFAAEADGTFAFAPGTGWKLFDVSCVARAMSKPAPGAPSVHGLLLRFTDESRGGKDENWTEYQFVSREGSGQWRAYRPVLMVVDPAQSQAIREFPLLDITALLALPEAEFREYVRKTPPSPSDILEMNTLGLTASRTEDARRIFRRAAFVAADGPYATLIEVNRAYVEIQAGRLDEAEDILRKVMQIHVPESLLHDYRRVVYVLFVAPQYMAEILEKRGQFDQADRLLAESGDKAYALAKAHPDVRYLPSYVASAYYHRVILLLESKPGSSAEARQLAEECRTRVPNYEGPCDFGVMIRCIESYERKHVENGSRSDGSGEDPSRALPAQQ